MKFFLFTIFSITSSFCFGQKEITFEKKNSYREFSMSLPYPCIIKLKNGKKQMGIICSQNDSGIFLKTIFSGSNFINDTLKWKEIKSDTSLSRKEKLLQYMCISYPDSINYSYDSIKKIHFDLMYTKKGNLRTIGGLTFLLGGFFIFMGFMDRGGDLSDVPFIFGPIELITSYYIFRETTNKNIRTKKWKLKKPQMNTMLLI